MIYQVLVDKTGYKKEVEDYLRDLGQLGDHVRVCELRFQYPKIGMIFEWAPDKDRGQTYMLKALPSFNGKLFEECKWRTATDEDQDFFDSYNYEELDS